MAHASIASRSAEPWLHPEPHGRAGGGRNPVTNRLLRHFNFISFAEMSDDSINRIFATILGAFLRCVKIPPPPPPLSLAIQALALGRTCRTLRSPPFANARSWSHSSLPSSRDG